MSYEKFRERVLAKDGKLKRILAVDGGGIRGLITVQFLKRIEKIIREKTGDDNALLKDYFHLVGGTSTGSVIAALVAIGKTADEMDTMYRTLGTDVFKPDITRMGIFRSKYSSKKIADALQAELNDMTMEDVAELGIGYCAVTKRLDTSSAWPIDNNPEGTYFNKPGAYPNKDYLLRQIIRASTAAPTYFDPELIEVEPGKPGLFVDGGVSPHNDPAFQLYMLATIAGYGYNWETGDDKIFVLSLGTGCWATQLDNVEKDAKDPAFKNGLTSLASLMNDSRELNELVMQWIGKPTGPVEPIDSVVGDLANELMADRALCSYMRYNIRIEKDWLANELGLDYPEEMVKNLRDLGEIKMLDEFAKLGQVYAEKKINPEEIL